MSRFQTEENEKLALKQCKAILTAGGDIYTDDQILKIRDFLYELAAIEVEHFKTLNDEKAMNEKLSSEKKGHNSNNNYQ